MLFSFNWTNTERKKKEKYLAYGIYNRRVINMNLKLKKFHKAIIAVILVLILAFGIWNALWFFYRYKCFSKIVNDSNYFKQNSDISKSYLYTEVDETSKMTYNYSVFFPDYLKFSKNYCCLPTIEINDDGTYANDYFVALTIKPKLFGEYRYTLTIYDFKTANEQYLAGNNNNLEYNVFELEVDKELNVIKELSYGSEKMLQNAYNESKETFNHAKKIFKF